MLSSNPEITLLYFMKKIFQIDRNNNVSKHQSEENNFTPIKNLPDTLILRVKHD